MAMKPAQAKQLPFEKLGAFYLGRVLEAPDAAPRPEPLLYDARDLTTHAVCLGMTGSGKTGLCVSLLEEAAIDGIPAIVIDPKGDLGNLLLTFPKLHGSDFRPWIDEAEAARQAETPESYATATAERWRRGLAEWGQDAARIARLRAAADFAIYTPGSDAGLPLTVLRSFAAPPTALRDDGDALRERISAAVAGLLGLLGLDADPVRSRDHILLSTILDREWRAGRDLEIADLIRAIQSPGFDRIGVMDLESVYPARDRSALAMSLNNLLASPGFAAWLEGEPLDVASLLWTSEGRPRVSVLSIAHLSENERMFFVTILLNEVTAWMRSQPGTASLRALLYMDEVFGYLPPTANPPSKIPMLTLLKQARAYGLGVVLATQNPVDLDYKALSNAGTWFLGRLQTERDKARVVEGLEGASATTGARFDKARLEAILAGLKSRVFLMNNVHEDQPVLFHTRWALSYLRGPLTRAQIRTLMQPRREAPGAQALAPPAAAAVPPAAPPQQAGERPVVPGEVEELFLPGDRPTAADTPRVYRPALVGVADLHFARSRLGVDVWQPRVLLAPLRDDTLREVWAHGERLPDEPAWSTEPEADAGYAALPAPAARAKSYAAWERALKTHLYREQTLSVWRSKPLRLVSRVGETEAEFKVRIREALRERRDLELAKLQKSYAPKLKRLQAKIQRAEEKVGREESQYSSQKMQTAISVGATLLGALFGRKAASVGSVGRATTAMRGAGRAAREKEDVTRAQRGLEKLQKELAALEEEFQEELARIRDAVATEPPAPETIAIRPRKSDITVRRVALVWTVSS